MKDFFSLFIKKKSKPEVLVKLMSSGINNTNQNKCLSCPYEVAKSIALF